MRTFDRWIRPALLAASGSLLICLSVAPIDLWWCAFVAWAPLTLLAAQAARSRQAGDRRAVLRAAGIALAIAFGRWLWLEQWIGEVSDAGWPALALCMAIFDALFVWALARSESRVGQSRWPLAVRAVVLLMGCEWMRGRVFMEGYPWFMPAQPLIEWPLIAQAACVVGAAGMGVLPASIAGALADAWLGRSDAVARRRWLGGALAALCVLVACVVFGAARMANGTAEPVRTLALLAVQTNVKQSNKDAPDRHKQDEQVTRLLQLTMQGLDDARAAGRRVDLVAWPETVVPGFGFEPDAILMQKQRGLWPADRYVAPIQELAARGTPILLGSGAFVGLRVEGDRYAWANQFNSAYLVRGEQPPERIDKTLLTPFGETMPYISKWKWLEQQLLELGARGMRFDLQPGESPRLLTVPAGEGTARIGVPICFEDTVSRATRAIARAGEGAQALVNLSNDGWFGDFDGARLHHEQAARWRSIELGCSLARVANTGTSSAFDAHGRRIAPALPCRSDGVSVIELPLAATATPFLWMGDVASWAMFLGAIAMSIRFHRSGVAAAAPIVALLLAGVPGCDSDKQSRVPSWSSREQSMTPDGSAKLSPGSKPRAAIPVSLAGDPKRNAGQLLDEASRSTDPMIRAIALEAMEPDPVLLEPAVRRGLGDPNAGVRYVAAVVGSKAKLQGLAPLVEPLLLDPNDSVRAAAILALHRAGRNVDPSPLGRMIISQSPEVRGNAAMVIGDMGNKSALPMLSEALLSPMPRALPAQVRVVDLQIGEAMAKLGDMGQLEPIHAALFSRGDQGECIGLACQIVGTLRDQSAMPMLQRLIDADGSDTRPVEIRLVAAVAVMHILRPGPAALVELGLLGSMDMRPEVRGISAKLLGFFPTAESEAALTRLLRDRDPAVQVAAAASILKIAAASAPSGTPR